MYGGFAAAYSLFLLISTAQVALIAEPMSIFGAERYSGKIASYLNYLLRVQWLGSLLVTLMLLFFASFLAEEMLRDAMVGMAVVLPLILFHWYFRRAFYLEMQSELAMVSSLAYAAVVLSVVVLCQYSGRLTSFLPYIAMALGSLVASSFTLKRLRLKFFGFGAAETDLNTGKIGAELWDFGKWILLAYLASWFTSLSYPFLITVWIDAPSAGVFRALQNLFLPFQQLLAAVTLLLLPWLSRQASTDRGVRFFHRMEIAAALVGVVAATYCLVIIYFRRQILFFLYANDFYSSFDDLVVYMAIAALIGSMPLILGLGLRILKRPNVILWAKGGSALCAFVVGLPLIWAYQMNGVILLFVGSSLLEAAILLFFYSKVRNITKLSLGNI
jgi:O-antigen/teichoic acid export membrane protein